MKSLKHLVLLCLFGPLIAACSSGDIRAMNDALSKQNGNNVSYPDQSDTTYVGDIKWVSGVRGGSGFQKITNNSDDYCKIRVKFEDGSYKYFKLAPGQGTGSMYVSLYNQGDYMRSICSSDRSVYDESFSS